MAPLLFLATTIGALLIMGASANNLQYPQQAQEAMTDAFIDSMDGNNVIRAMQKRPFCNIYAGCGKKRSAPDGAQSVTGSPAAGPSMGGSPTAPGAATGPAGVARTNNGRDFVSVVDLVGMQRQLIEQLASLTDTIMDRHVEMPYRLPMSGIQAEYRQQQTRQKRSLNSYSLRSMK